MLVNGPNGILNIGPTALVSAPAQQSVLTLDIRGGTFATGTNTLNLGGTLTGMPLGTQTATVSGNLALALSQSFTAADSGSVPGLTISAKISGAGGVNKQGTGTVILANTVTNTYAGTTTVNEGTLLLSATGDALQTLNFAGAANGATFALAFNGADTANITYTTTVASTLAGKHSKGTQRAVDNWAPAIRWLARRCCAAYECHRILPGDVHPVGGERTSTVIPATTVTRWKP